MGTDRLKVDLNGLEQFASTLEGIRRTLDGTRNLFNSYAGEMGSGKVADALDDFDSNWKDGRKEIDGQLQGLSKMADGVVQELRQTDGKLQGELAKSTRTEGGKK